MATWSWYIHDIHDHKISTMLVLILLISALYFHRNLHFCKPHACRILNFNIVRRLKSREWDKISRETKIAIDYIFIVQARSVF